MSSRGFPVVRQKQTTVTIETTAAGLYDVTGEARSAVAESAIALGQLTLYVRHTSASLLIQENADADVRHDLEEFFRRLVPEETPWFRHREEGPDDMPSHIKSALTQTSLTIPIAEGTLALGTWQAVFLFEHRAAPHRRQIVMHALGT
ncbi:MAG: secondary thiamine-phosphate synthase enzyme YjbQ [Hyphomicrobiales bacterium]